ncbi:MAG: cytochrome c biogenesis protein CcsA [Acidobacteria bacterium]|nr:cytochrome c biogenesis protein CcsA [Acidobacteriota bacterium]MBV8892320.1 cytochrome c biogenesis protein CcsA [Acidobacteriota bacterium]MBV9481466.1 cytochrome c biogenesis protein CcsA [Acidobacteriota bacterium]
MPLLWLRVSVGCYAVGLTYALVALTRSSELLGRIALHAAYLGMIFQFVSLSEAVESSGQLTLASIHNSVSLLAFIIMAFFMLAYAIYRTTSPGIIVFPAVFLLTFLAATGQQPILFTSTGVRTSWLFLHIALIFTGYAALILSFGASLLYLVQERSLKAKKPADIFSRLPALETIDEIGYRSLLVGFPFMTLGLIAGIVVAETTYGRVKFLDPKVTLSVLMWAVYMIMLYMRWNSGWRGRRAAFLAASTFAAAIIAWAANYFSSIHKFIS